MIAILPCCTEWRLLGGEGAQYVANDRYRYNLANLLWMTDILCSVVIPVKSIRSTEIFNTRGTKCAREWKQNCLVASVHRVGGNSIS